MIAKHIAASLTSVTVLLGCATVGSGKERSLPGAAVADVQSCLPPGQIQMGGHIGRRMADCMENLITAWDLDRLVQPFRDKTDGKPFEGLGFPDHWRCDYWGKWFTALAGGYAHRSTPENRQLMDRAVRELIATQEPDGSITSFEGEKRLVAGYDVWGRQCVILGLVAHYDLTGDRAALDAACRVLDSLIDELDRRNLRIPDLGWPGFMGLAPSVIVESGALLYQRTGLKKYRDFAERIAQQWSEPSKFLPHGLRLVEDALAGKPAREVGHPKAYEQLYCFIGICELYRATGDRKYLDAAVALAKNIREDELFVTGTGSEDERWFGGRSQQTRLVNKPAETCVTAHWMHLCWQLLRLTGDPAYADEMETSLYNALLGALMPEGHWWAYYNSLMGQRLPSWVHQADAGLSCCVVSGSRGLTLTPRWAVMQSDDGPVVNLYFPGKAEAKTASGARVSLTIDTDYPRDGTVRMSVAVDRPETFAIALRIPAWSEATALAVNGDALSVRAGTYAKLHRQWNDGDRVELTFDMRARILEAPDGNGQLAVKRGPIVLALDNRLASPEPNAAAMLDRSAAPLIAVKSNSEAADKFGVWIAVDVPFVVNGRQRMLTMCDYASAGNLWSDDNQFRVGLPQPLDLGTMYETGVTWKTLTGSPAKPEAPAVPVKRASIRADRILFLGNSITLTPPAPEVDWAGNWGMAASAEDKDYVHLLANSIAALTGRKPETSVSNIAAFERSYETYDIESRLKEQLDFKADIVVVAIGENVPALASEASKAKFKESFLRLLQAVKQSGRPVIYVRSCFWPDKIKDDIMRQSCEAVGGVFVDISGLDRDESNHARSEREYTHNGVAGHPGDKGMKAIAETLLRAMMTRQVAR